METKEKPKPTPDYLMQLMNDKKLMSSLPNFCGIFNHLERLLDEGNADRLTCVCQRPGLINYDGNDALVVLVLIRSLIIIQRTLSKTSGRFNSVIFHSGFNWRINLD